MKGFCNRTAFIFSSYLSLLLTFTCSAQDSVRYGLRFNSHEVNRDLRTGLQMPSAGTLELSDAFSISFDLSFLPKKSKYGYVFRLILNNEESIDLISNSKSARKPNLALIRGEKNTKIVFSLTDMPQYRDGDWLHVMIHFDPGSKKIQLSVNDRMIEDTFTLRVVNNVNLLFGANNVSGFATIDVPPIQIKEVQIREKSGGLAFYWDLKQHAGNQIHDLIQNRTAIAVNPHWLIDGHSKWRLRAKWTTPHNPQISFDKQAGVLHAVTADSIRFYKLSNDSLYYSNPNAGGVSNARNNQVIFNSYRNQIWLYNIRHNFLNPFVIDQNKWMKKTATLNEPLFWHHNRFISPIDSSLYVFGGYGNFTYKNHLQRYDESLDSFVIVKPKGFIKPRYLSAAGPGRFPGEVIIFGGYGNESGDQELSPKYLYDLHALDLKTFQYKKLWEMQDRGEEFVVANSLVSNAPQNSFYVLCFPIHKYSSFLYLRKFSFSGSENIIVGDTIPYFFHDTQSYCDLFLSEPTNELIAVSTFPITDSTATITVYSINYPAISQEGVLQANHLANGKSFGKILIVGISIVSVVVVAFLIRRKKKITVPDRTSAIDNETTVVEQSTYQASSVSELKSKHPYADNQIGHTGLSPAILFVGGFNVLNTIGENISLLFTPTLKQMLAAIIVYSNRNGKGITSAELKNILWPDKSEESARNNRGVSIKKLRTLLQNVGAASIVNEGNYWKFVPAKDIFCDYFRIEHLLKNPFGNRVEENGELIALISKGKLLPEMEYDWLDPVKSDYSSKVIDAMVTLAANPGIRPAGNLLMISDIIFLQDPLNESALRIKCRELCLAGKNSVAKSTFDNFSHIYESMLGMKFNTKFEDLLREIQMDNDHSKE